MDHAEEARGMAAEVGRRSRAHASDEADMITDALLAATHALLAIHDRMGTPGAGLEATRPRGRRHWRAVQ